jgi:hypothetical protein
MADIGLPERAKHCVADCVHEGIRVGMAVQAFVMWNVDPAKDQLAVGNQSMDVVASTNMNHSQL